MKIKESWKRITAAALAGILLLGTADDACMAAFHANIPSQTTVRQNMQEVPTGLMQTQWIAYSEDKFHGDVLDYKELVAMQSYSMNYNSEWDQYSTNYFYNQLSEEWKEAWEALDALCLAYLSSPIDAVYEEGFGYYTEMVTLPEGMTVEEGQTLLTMFMASNTQYYFLGNGGILYTTDTRGRYMESVSMGIYHAFADGNMRTRVTAEFKEAIEDVVSSIPEDASESEKLRLIHDYVVNKVEYDYDIIEDDITFEEEELAFTQSAYSVFCMDSTVCAGYAEALQILCNAVGIDAINVTSYDHMWNKVRIYDAWYNVDPTWADMSDNGQIYYDYYGRSDAVYDQDSLSEAISHTEEEFWLEYLPVCKQDTAPKNATEPGIFTEPSIMLTAPTITVTKAADGKYRVVISGILTGQEVYYTLDGTTPSVASTKSMKYTGPFYVEEDYDIKAVQIRDGFGDSPIAHSTRIPAMENVKVDDRFYQKMKIAWDSLGKVVDGYEITILNSDTKEKLQSILIDASISEYELDTSAYQPGDSLEIQICSYVEDDSAVRRSESWSAEYTVKAAPLGNVDFEWYVLKENEENRLAIVLEEGYQLYYCPDLKNMDVYYVASPLSQADGDIHVYVFDSEYVPYDETGYLFICDTEKMTAWQEEGISVGGTFAAPILKAVEDVTLSDTDKSAVLEVEITNPVEDFYYRYQWYVSDTQYGTAEPIEGATGSTYEVSVDTGEIRYFFCRVFAEYGEVSYVDTTNVNGRRTKVQNTSEVQNKISISSVDNQTYTGKQIVPDLTVTFNGKVLTQGVDYDVEFATGTDNINVGTVAFVVVLKGNYEGTAEGTFQIVPLDVTTNTSVSVKEIKDQTYTGKEIKPAVSVTNGTVTLKEGTDYTVSYKNNVNVGTAKAIITFRGNYTGVLEKTFKIIKETPSVPTEITSSKVSVDSKNGYISKITAGTTVKTLLEALNEKDYVKIYDKNNKLLENTAVVGTGMKAVLMDGSEKVKEYQIVVTGDTNGDGKINITDMIAVKAHILKKETLTGASAKAADVNSSGADGKINITDFIRIKAHILKKDTIKGMTV